jgi:hypothetical protein
MGSFILYASHGFLYIFTEKNGQTVREKIIFISMQQPKADGEGVMRGWNT